MNIPKIFIPALVVVALLSGYVLRTAFTQPTTAVTLEAVEGKKLVCIVEGVKCKGTAQFFTTLYDDVAGINGIETYASEHRVHFMYDPSIITPDEIRAVMEAPILFDDGESVQVFRCLSMEEI